MPLTTNSIVTRVNDDHIISKVGNETVMMNTRTGKYIGINSVGSDIWNIIGEPIPVQQIIDAMMKTYDVPVEVCTSQVLGYLEKLREEGLLLIVA